MKLRMPSVRRGQRGSSMLEGSLVLLTIIVMTTFVMDMGQVLMFLQFFGERSRAGARYAAVHVQSPDTVRNFILYNSPTAPPAGTGFMGLTASNVDVRYVPEVSPRFIEVTIHDYPMHFYTPLMAGAHPSRPYRTVVPVASLGSAP